MKNYVQAGESIEVAAPAPVAAGDGVLAGKIFGVAQQNATTGEGLTLVRRGVFDMPKVSAQAWTVGAKIYWHAANGECTTAASGNTLIGAAVEAAADPSAVGRVLLDGAIR